MREEVPKLTADDVCARPPAEKELAAREPVTDEGAVSENAAVVCAAAGSADDHLTWSGVDDPVMIFVGVAVTIASDNRALLDKSPP